MRSRLDICPFIGLVIANNGRYISTRIRSSRHSFCVFVLLSFFIPAASYAESTEGKPAHGAVHDISSFRVAALNTEWLWTPHDGRVDGSRFNRGDLSPQDYADKLAFFVSIITEHQVDIVALSEIENEQVAQEFSNALGPKWAYAFRQGRDTATGQDVALLSRIGTITNITDFGFPAGDLDGYKSKRLSKVVGMTIQLEASKSRKAENIGFITSHFLSKRNESKKKAAKRLMQAKAIVKASKAFDDIDALVIAGDLNDWAHSAPVKTISTSLQLSNANQSCALNAAHKSVKYMVDHILFKGLRCAKLITVDLSPYSDHPIVIAELAF